MAINDLRQELEEAREKFNNSTWPDFYAAVDDDWEDENDDLGLSESDWTPRKIAEHTVGSELFMANLIATTLGLQTIPKRSINYQSANDVPEDHDSVAKATNEIYDLITDEDLEKIIAEAPEAINFDGTIGGLISAQISHLIEHADRLRCIGFGKNDELVEFQED